MFTRSLRFDDELYKNYVEAAENRNVSFNWLVHKILEEALPRLEDPDEFKVLA
jgi:predicted HicB family RNase H-like nuclease